LGAALAPRHDSPAARTITTTAARPAITLRAVATHIPALAAVQARRGVTAPTSSTTTQDTGGGASSQAPVMRVQPATTPKQTPKTKKPSSQTTTEPDPFDTHSTTTP
jgi:hypothetical protein